MHGTEHQTIPFPERLRKCLQALITHIFSVLLCTRNPILLILELLGLLVCCITLGPFLCLIYTVSKSYATLRRAIRRKSECKDEMQVQLGNENVEHMKSWYGSEIEYDRAMGFARVKNKEGVWVRPDRVDEKKTRKRVARASDR